MLLILVPTFILFLLGNSLPQIFHLNDLIAEHESLYGEHVLGKSKYHNYLIDETSPFYSRELPFYKLKERLYKVIYQELDISPKRVIYPYMKIEKLFANLPSDYHFKYIYVTAFNFNKNSNYYFDLLSKSKSTTEIEINYEVYLRNINQIIPSYLVKKYINSKSFATTTFKIPTTRDQFISNLITLTMQPEIISVFYLESFQFIPILDGESLMTLRNSFNTHYIQSHNGTSVLWEHGIHGENQLLGICDSGIDTNHCAFSDTIEKPINSINCHHRKVISYESTSTDYTDVRQGHGTHVCGTACGEFPDGKYNGIAYKAKIVFLDLLNGYEEEIPNIETELFGAAYDKGVRIHSNSWGFTSFQYSQSDYLVDKFVYEHPDFLPVFAAGNDGRIGMKTIGSPAHCKNCLSVGAVNGQFVDNIQYVSPYSSRGPSGERIKPDIVAPGSNVVSSSAGSKCEMNTKSGTSMSTPLVAGSLILLRQYLFDGFYPSGKVSEKDSIVPSASLLKAMIIHSAIDIKGYNENYANKPFLTTPNFYQGFGRVVLENVVDFDKSRNLFLTMSSVSTDSPHQYNLELKAGEIKVTMVYTDPVVIFDNGTLHNDIDIVLMVGNTPIYPNSLNRPDRQNNVEVIRYTIAKQSLAYLTLSLVRTISPEQEYSLVISGTYKLLSSKNITQITKYSDHNACMPTSRSDDEDGDQANSPTDKSSTSSKSLIYAILIIFSIFFVITIAIIVVMKRRSSSYSELQDNADVIPVPSIVLAPSPVEKSQSN